MAKPVLIESELDKLVDELVRQGFEREFAAGLIELGYQVGRASAGAADYDLGNPPRDSCES